MVDFPPVTRVVAALVALVGWYGLAVQFNASLARVGTAPETIWIMLRYFTVIANLLTAIVLTSAALGLARLASPFLLGGIAVVMILVGTVYALLLQGLLELSAGARLASDLLHVATPVLAPLYWLLFAPKGRLKSSAPWCWALLPLGYFGYALVRGRIEGHYAYPFLDGPQIGWLQVTATALVMALCFVMAGFILLQLDHVLASRRRAQ